MKNDTSKCMVRTAAELLRQKIGSITVASSPQRGGLPIVAGLASIPSREDWLRRVVQKVLPQVDKLFICLNGYESIPEFLSTKKKVVVVQSNDIGDLRDNAKFLPLYLVPGEFYFVALDDDLDYPSNYVARLIDGVLSYAGAAVVGVHGAIYMRSAVRFRDRVTLHYSRGLPANTAVSILGTGTVAGVSSVWRRAAPCFDVVGMADLVVGAALKSARVPAIALARNTDWLRPFEREEDEASLYRETTSDSSRHDSYIGLAGPWGFEPIRAATSILESSAANAGCLGPLVEFGTQVEAGSDPSEIVIPWHPSLASLAEFLSWRSLLGAGVRGLAGLYALRPRPEPDGVASEVALKVVSQAGGETTISWDHLELDIETGGVAVSRMLLKHGDAVLAAVHASLVWLVDADELALPVLFHALAASGATNDAIRVYKELRGRADVGPPGGLIDYAQALVSEGKDAEFYDILPDLLRAGPRGIAAAAEFAAQRRLDWSEDSALSALKLGKPGRWRRDFAEGLRGSPQVVQDPRRWVDAAAEAPADVGLELASIVLSARKWPASAVVPHLSTLEYDEKEFWQAEVRRQSGEGISAFVSGVNAVLLRHGLTPVSVQEEGNRPPNVLDALRVPELHRRSTRRGPRISVVVAAYNSCSTLQYALRSVAEQTHGDVELIVVDDASDAPVEIAEDISARVPVKVIRLERNGGPYVCRNAALKIASGEYVTTHDSDDWMHPQHLERKLESLLANTRARAVYSRHIRVSQDGHFAFENHGRFVGDGPMTGMFVRSVFDVIGEFAEVRTRGDMEFKSRLISEFGPGSIIQNDEVSLLALAWHSNSKQHLSTWKKRVELASFKRRYAQQHRFRMFAREFSGAAPQSEGTPV